MADFEATARRALHEAMQHLGTAADAMRHARRPDLSEAIAEAQRQVGALYDAACRDLMFRRMMNR